MADFLNIFAALEQGDCETISCTILDSNDDVILLAAVACFMRRELTRVNGYFEVTIPAYLSRGFENHFRMTSETCQLWTQEIFTLGGIQLAIHLGGPQFCQKNKCCSSFGVWQTGNRIVRSPTLGTETKPDISCEWNTKFSIIPEIPSKRVHFSRNFYRSIQFRTGNLGIFGRMESALCRLTSNRILFKRLLRRCEVSRRMSYTSSLNSNTVTTN